MIFILLAGKKGVIKVIGEKLLFLRVSLGLTQTEVARALGVSVPTISHYETDSRDSTVENLIKIANYFKVSLDWLTGRDTSKDINPESILSLEELKKQKRIEKLQKELEELQKEECRNVH